jgi:hypothetical protein
MIEDIAGFSTLGETCALTRKHCILAKFRASRNAFVGCFFLPAHGSKSL